MNLNKLIHGCLAVLMIIGLFGCVSITKTAPQGFAVYNGIIPFKFLPYKSVSPDGVMFRVRKEKNDPYADLLFWRTAMKTHMLESGYYFISESDIQAGNHKGYLIELSAPVGEQDFSYLIAIFTVEKKIVIAEACGEISAVRKRRPSIDKSIHSLF